MAGKYVFESLDAPHGLVLIHGPHRLTDCRDNRRRLDRAPNRDPARRDHELVTALLVQAVDGGPCGFLHSDLMNLFHDTHYPVPVALVAGMAELELRTNRGAPSKVAIRKSFVDDRHLGVRTAVRYLKEAAFAQTRADGREVIASHEPDERDLVADPITVAEKTVTLESRFGPFHLP